MRGRKIVLAPSREETPTSPISAPCFSLVAHSSKRRRIVPDILVRDSVNIDRITNGGHRFKETKIGKFPNPYLNSFSPGIAYGMGSALDEIGTDGVPAGTGKT